MEAAGALKIPPWAKIRAPELEAPKVPELPALAPAVEKQVEQITAAAEKLDQPLASMGDKLRASLSRTFSDLGKRAGELGAAIKQRIGGAFSGLVGLFEGVAGRLKGVFVGLGGFLAGAGLAEAIRIATRGIDEFTKKVQKLGEQSRVLGIPVEQLQELQRWARDANLPLKTLDTNLARLTRTIGEVAAGKNKKATELFKELNIAVTDAVGKARPTADVLRDIATAIASMTSEADRARVGFEFFGKNWEGMVDALSAGPEAIDAAAKAQQDLGVITQKQVEQVKEYQKALRGVGEQWRGIGSDFEAALGEVLLPVLTPVLQQLEAWLKVNREWIQLGIREALEGIAGAFAQLAPVVASTAADFGLIVKGIGAVGEAWDTLTGKGGPWDKTLAKPDLTSMIPADFELPDPTKDWDPITKIREAIISAVIEIEKFLASISTKLGELGGDIWLGTLEKIKVVWEAIAKAVETVAGAWKALTGTAWEQPRAPAVPPVAWEQPRGAPALPPTAVSTGGGPLTWETLGGQPGGLIGPPAGGQPASGRVDVVIENKNPPPGTRTTAKATGPGVTTDVGQSMPWTAPAYGAGPWAPAGA
jgi:hypothetical protein